MLWPLNAVDLAAHAWRYAVEWAVAVGALRFALDLLFRRRVYRSANNEKLTTDAITALLALPRAARLGGELYEQHVVPYLVVAPLAGSVAMGSVYSRGYEGVCAVVVTVWTLRGFPPLVADPEPPKARKDDIVVLYRASNREGDCHLGRSLEGVTPADLPPNCPLARCVAPGSPADLVAAAMADAFKQGGCNAKVFVLHGHPGAGKSTAVRLLARRLEAALYAEYDPTSTGNNMRTLISLYANEDSMPLVVAYEECDVTMGLMADGRIKQNDHYQADAINKSQWNALLDMVKRRANVLLVLTTNCSRAELAALVERMDPHGSMLRAGRVDAHFEWSAVPGQPPTRSEPFTAPENVWEEEQRERERAAAVRQAPQEETGGDGGEEFEKRSAVPGQPPTRSEPSTAPENAWEEEHQATQQEAEEEIGGDGGDGGDGAGSADDSAYQQQQSAPPNAKAKSKLSARAKKWRRAFGACFGRA